MSPRGSLDVVSRRKFPSPAENRIPVFQTKTNHYRNSRLVGAASLEFCLCGYVHNNPTACWDSIFIYKFATAQRAASPWQVAHQHCETRALIHRGNIDILLVLPLTPKYSLLLLTENIWQWMLSRFTLYERRNVIWIVCKNEHFQFFRLS